MERKEHEFKGSKEECWEQGDVSQLMLQPEHCQDLSRTLVKVYLAVLERKGQLALWEGKL